VSPFPCTTMAPPPETAKDGINEKDPATALGEWYVTFHRFHIFQCVLMVISISESCNAAVTNISNTFLFSR
jgi:hypothetical protein